MSLPVGSGRDFFDGRGTEALRRGATVGPKRKDGGAKTRWWLEEECGGMLITARSGQGEHSIYMRAKEERRRGARSAG